MLMGKIEFDLLNDEFNESKNNSLTEEEIEKLTTKDNFTPLQKAVNIMKKGYEVQKKSIV